MLRNLPKRCRKLALSHSNYFNDGPTRHKNSFACPAIDWSLRNLVEVKTSFFFFWLSNNRDCWQFCLANTFFPWPPLCSIQLLHAIWRFCLFSLFSIFEMLEGSVIQKVSKAFRKSNSFYRLIRIRMFPYIGVRNVSFFRRFCERTIWVIQGNNFVF